MLTFLINIENKKPNKFHSEDSIEDYEGGDTKGAEMYDKTFKSSKNKKKKKDKKDKKDKSKKNEKDVLAKVDSFLAGVILDEDSEEEKKIKKIVLRISIHG